ncbi:MAG: Beta-galactosidase BoGH2A [Luteibacter sp.]|uniref:beta-1,3-glucanase family protein n=1 Tax=Luteibacter sp. TaxID=1886636 RepID=UPI0013821F68|nr:beta-1,3-glucanase family protein [Luteibacter sp.]KAF1009659.1 MAG: Beta-galactosidase BoGH2A [Luteibacter sp.]
MKRYPESPQGVRRRRLSSLVTLTLVGFTMSASAVTVAPSDRQDINLGAQPWKYTKQSIVNPNDPTVYAPLPNGDEGAAVNFDDSKWLTVGLPHAANDFTTFINQESGGGQGSLDGETSWYRTKLADSASYRGKKVMVEFEGAHTGDRVYVNGRFIPGTGVLNQPGQPDAQATHVIGFLPHIVDLTPYLNFDGKDVLAVQVSRSGGGFFEDPGFSGAFRFGQSEAGIFRPVKLHVTNLVHIPENVYAGQNTWGTYVATQALSPDHASATIRVQTNVANESGVAKTVTLITQIVDANGKEVARDQQDKTLAPTQPQNDNATPIFDQTLTVSNPTLWFPNGSPDGKPYLYRVIHTVSIDGQVVDAKQSTLGIRVITWDKDFPYVNGKKQYLVGGSGRYDYPALGSSVPEEQQWRDLKDMAAMGGNLWRPGHSPSSPEFVEAADALGVFIVQPSGDGENGFANQCNPSDKDYQQCKDMWTIKREVHRDIVIRDRSHPSIVAWEHDNGQMDTPFAQELRNLARKWDNVSPRAAADRTPNDQNGDILSCSKAGCETHLHQVDYPNKPAWGAEYWGPGGSRSAYDTELAFALNYLVPFSQARAVNTFGMAQWYYADTPGEVIEQVDGLEDATHWAYGRNPDGSIATHPDGTPVKGFRHNSRGNNASMTDANRFPRMLYYIYESVWMPYTVKPMVKLANTWNRTGDIKVDAFSNCPAVCLLINGVPQGSDQVPNRWDSIDTASYDAENGPVDEKTGKIVGVDKAQQTTKLPGQVHWNVTWQAGSAVAQCIDGGVVRTDANGNPVQDTLYTAGPADHIDLQVVNTSDPIRKPDGTVFQVTANGSDAAFIVARVLDAQNHLVPDATQKVNFDVTSGDSLVTYQGGTQAYVDYSAGEVPDPNGGIAEPMHYYHAPGSHELQFEGGLQKIALRTKFATGAVQVTATANGLKPGSVSFNIAPVPQAPTVSGPPSIIAQPNDDSVTVGDVGHFSVTASGAPPLTFTWKKNGVEIQGANQASYTTPATILDDNNAKYTVVVHGQGPDQESTPATLSVAAFQQVNITQDPVSINVDQGQVAHFTVRASGSPTLKYQWMKNGQPIADANGTTYDTAALNVSDSGSTYAVVVSNFGSQMGSKSAQLTVNPARPPAFTGTLPDVRANPGQPATFDVSTLVAGTSPFHYKWSHNGQAIGDDLPTLTINGVTQNDVGTYSVSVTNVLGDGAVATTSAKLTLAPPGANLARQKPTQSTAVENPNGTASWQAVDGDETTRWGSKIGDNDAALTVDLGASRVFNRVVIKWENAHASDYKVQYSDSPDTGFQDAMPEVTNSQGGVEDMTFPHPVKGRYVRMQGVKRATDYGYSIYEFEVYNSVTTGDNGDRYQLVPGTIDGKPTTDVRDTLSGLQWDRIQRGFTDQGAQFTQSVAVGECAKDNMRLPTRDEALAISGQNASTSAFPGAWTTWTDGQDPTDATFAYQVTSQGVVNRVVAENNPSHVLCVAGAKTVAPGISAQPASQTVGATRAAKFAVTATGVAPFTYDWYRVTQDANGHDVETFQSSTSDGTYTTKALTAADNGARFRVKVTSAQGLISVSSDAIVTVDNSTNGVDPIFGTTPDQPNQPNNPNQPGTGTPGDGQGGTNIAVHAKATSNGNENDGYLAPAGAVDGDFTTRWGSKFQPESWIELDLGSQQIFDHVILRWENAYSTQYTIEVSNDEATWQSVSPQPYAGLGGVERRDFAAQTARYVRMHSTARATNYGVSLWEFEVYAAPLPKIIGEPQSAVVTAGQTATFTVGVQANGTVGYQWRRNAAPIQGATQATFSLTAGTADAGSYDVVVTDNAGRSVTSTPVTLTVNPVKQPQGTPPVSSNTNLALHQPITASDVENPVAFKAANANDGDTGTRWSSGFTNDQWISVDLGAVKTVNKVVLTWENAHATDYLIEVSIDGQKWNTVDENPASTGGVETRSFAAVSARYVRMHGVKRSTQYGYSLWEMEVYGPDDGSTTPPPPPPPPQGGNDPSQGFNYDVYPGFIGASLLNKTNGKWRDDQIFVEVIAKDAANNGVFSWVKPDGTIVAMNIADNTGPGHLTKNGDTFPNYAFTLAQAKLLKLPPLFSGRIFVSVGEPLYMKNVLGADGVLGFAGPNPLNGTDPNLNIQYDWYEFTWGDNGIWINTTQVDQFSIPLTLDLYGDGKTNHQKAGITETRDQIFTEYNKEVPAEFQIANLGPDTVRILAPGKDAFDAGKPQAHYYDAYIDQMWQYYENHTLKMTIGQKEFEGVVVDGVLTFQHTNWSTFHEQDEPEGMLFNVSKPSTQDVLEGKGNLANSHDPWGVEGQLEAQLCGAFNRHVVDDVSKWKDDSQYYLQAPSNYYSRFWHAHSIDGKAYGFSYDDVSDHSSSLIDGHPEHLEFGIGW